MLPSQEMAVFAKGEKSLWSNNLVTGLKSMLLNSRHLTVQGSCGSKNSNQKHGVCSTAWLSLASSGAHTANSFGNISGIPPLYSKGTVAGKTKACHITFKKLRSSLKVCKTPQRRPGHRHRQLSFLFAVLIAGTRSPFLLPGRFRPSPPGLQMASRSLSCPQRWMPSPLLFP